MSSRRSSRFSLRSPSIVQSPTSTASHRVSSPVTPSLQMEMDRVPFSRSFPGIIKARYEPDASFAESSCVGMARVSGDGVLNHSDSFHIEHITNVKEIDPEWEHDEIEEIMVISPKPKTRNSFLDLGTSKRISISDFEVLRVVGKEPSVQTILARSCSDFGVYAIKTLGKRTASTPNLLRHVRSEQTCLRMVTEGSCPFLPKLHRSFHDEARLYMILETYPGGSIAIHLDREGPFTSDKAQFYASELVEGLSYLHSLHIIHRDVKPENVMIAADGHIVLTNFSCAKILDQCDSTASDCGTREFEAPERILGWGYDYAVDVWSFGVLLCIMHFGQHPFLEGDELDPLLIMQKRILRGQAPSHPSQVIPLSEWNLIKKEKRNPQLRPNMVQIKTNIYFSDINWGKVKAKDYPASYIPYGDEVDLLDIDEDIFHFYEKSDLPALDDSPATDASDFDGFSFTWDPTMVSPGEQTAAEVDSSSEHPERRGVPFRTKKNKIQSILKSPSIHFAGDSKEAEHTESGDFLDLTHSISRQSFSPPEERPRKLRKKRDSGSGARSSVLSSRKSVVSMLGEFNILKGGSKTAASNNKGCENSVSGGTINLPKGITQSGRGIGFTYAPQASHSRLSLSSMKSQSCFKSISMLFDRRGSPPENVPRSRNEVIQQIYGSSWSIHTNEAQTSTVTFGIPDGLGRRVDSMDLQRQQLVQS